ncbi:sulfotransferase [Rhodanobacter sp. B04]|uniref:tetratricopeptide repeat-containing sulfotransferase family protein n=1 Tax=Rhodanobacter sp. B04 TaxID=1945860 RepID=UPI0009871485|nr:sulfotransferase [Rhodanobacter sp. B04]OOG62183.1 sulfotransferase [Rhodanobacter sp. B04]
MPDPNKLFAQATTAYNQGNWRQAYDVATPLLPLAPDHAGLHYLIGLAALGLKQMPQAVKHLQRAVKLDPLRAEYAAQFAKVLSLVNQPAVALRVVDRALTLSPLDAPTLDTLGVVLSRANEHERAVTLYERAVALAPARADLHYNLAKSLICLGRLDDADQEMEVCLDLAPQSWDIHLTLSQLRKQSRASNHLQRLQSLLPDSVGNPVAQLHLHLALFKEYEDLADYPRAFEHLAIGKAAGRVGRGYSHEQKEAQFAALTRALTEPQPAAAGFPTDEPIFVLGMPRSGTTLVERIISSHRDVHSAGELQNFPVSFKQVSGSRTPQLLDPETIGCASRIDWRKLGETYLSSTRPATGQKPRFIDKLPHNFLYAGFIANALPNAKIICLRRDPMDTCLSNFRQLFALQSTNYDYSFDLLDTGRYYVLFDRLMAHWQRLFPGRILEVDYETLVDSQENSSRQMLEFCGLSWDDACLRFEDNPAPVATASAVQVRRPMYRSSVKRWKHYEAQTADLQKLLIDAGIELKP